MAEKDPPKQLTVGRLDGLMIQPVVENDEIKFVDFTVDSLPGLRLVLEGEAARELCYALNVIFKRPSAGVGVHVSLEHTHDDELFVSRCPACQNLAKYNISG